MVDLPRFNIGTVANDGTGDKPRELGEKLNEAFTTLETLLSGSDSAASAAASAQVAQTAQSAAETAESGAQAAQSAAEAAQTTVEGLVTDLSDVAGLSRTKGNLIVGNGTSFIALGVGTDGQVLTADSGSSGGVAWGTEAGGSAPIDSTYVTLSSDATLTGERVLTAGSGISITDGGANTTVTVAADVVSVNSKTGAVTLNPDDLSDSATTNKFASAANIAAVIHAGTSKVTPADNDEIAISDSAATYGFKKLLWTNLKAALKASASAVWTGTSDVLFSTPKNIADSHAWQTLTDGATVSWDMSLGYNAKVTLGGNRTLATPTNAITGRVYQLQVVQDATGSRTLTFPASTIFDFGGAGTPTLSTTASKMDLLILTCLDASTPLFRVAFNAGS